ncbi:MAG: hypothetical protein KAS32_08160, partial [Candidatus Peribacteraceae bacterium]|nr:hypothetical protein [Candidatus Peribacteraceae bacterium]
MESKKKNMTILAGIVVIIIISLLAFSTMSVQSEFVIVDGTVIPQDICDSKGISDKVIVMHSHGCPACNIAVPILEELEDEMDVEFEYIDVSSDSDRLVELG